MTQELEEIREESYAEKQDEVQISHSERGRTGVLVPLKTVLEMRARESFISVYVTSVPVKQASVTLE
jgi:hypothetical protein